MKSFFKRFVPTSDPKDLSVQTLPLEEVRFLFSFWGVTIFYTYDNNQEISESSDDGFVKRKRQGEMNKETEQHNSEDEVNSLLEKCK